MMDCVNRFFKIGLILLFSISPIYADLEHGEISAIISATYVNKHNMGGPTHSIADDPSVTGCIGRQLCYIDLRQHNLDAKNAIYPPEAENKYVRLRIIYECTDTTGIQRKPVKCYSSNSMPNPWVFGEWDEITLDCTSEFAKQKSRAELVDSVKGLTSGLASVVPSISSVLKLLTGAADVSADGVPLKSTAGVSAESDLDSSPVPSKFAASSSASSAAFAPSVSSSSAPSSLHTPIPQLKLKLVNRSEAVNKIIYVDKGKRKSATELKTFSVNVDLGSQVHVEGGFEDGFALYRVDIPSSIIGRRRNASLTMNNTTLEQTAGSGRIDLNIKKVRGDLVKKDYLLSKGSSPERAIMIAKSMEKKTEKSRSKRSRRHAFSSAAPTAGHGSAKVARTRSRVLARSTSSAGSSSQVFGAAGHSGSAKTGPSSAAES